MLDVVVVAIVPSGDRPRSTTCQGIGTDIVRGQQRMIDHARTAPALDLHRSHDISDNKAYAGGMFEQQTVHRLASIFLVRIGLFGGRNLPSLCITHSMKGY